MLTEEKFFRVKSQQAEPQISDTLFVFVQSWPQSRLHDTYMITIMRPQQPSEFLFINLNINTSVTLHYNLEFAVLQEDHNKTMDLWVNC